MYTLLRLRLALADDALEIFSGPTSEGVAVNWTVGKSVSDESGFYLRLRSSVSEDSTIAFSAVFAWTSTPDTWALGECNKLQSDMRRLIHLISFLAFI